MPLKLQICYIKHIYLKNYNWELYIQISELPDSDAGVVPDTFAMRFSRV
jgi:hypothetical protein